MMGIGIAQDVAALNSSARAFVSRASTATYIDANGVLQTAGVNVPRYQGGALLVEGAATNLLLYSDAMNNALAWNTTCGVSDAGVIDGVRYWTIAKTKSTDSEQLNQINQSANVGDVYTESISWLAGTSTQVSLGLINEADTWGNNADSAATVVSGPGAVVQAVGGLFVVTGLSATVPTLVSITRTIRVAGKVGLILYPDTSSSTTIGKSVTAGRPDLESGSAATSYIPTTGAPAPRAPDVTAQV